MRLKFILIFFGILFLLPLVQSVCTPNFDKEIYSPGETISVTTICDESNEKSKGYTANWINVTSRTETDPNSTLEIDTGTTPSTVSEAFIETYLIPTSWNVSQDIAFNLTGSNLEGSENGNINTAGANSLLIASITHQGTFLGLFSSIDSNVADENDKAISGGFCDINVEDPTNDHVIHTVRSTMIDGNLDFIWQLEYEQFKEAKDYVGKISCFCGSTGSIYECIDEDGAVVNNSIGSSDVSFTTSEWINFLTDPLQTSHANGTRLQSQNLTAGFDRINWIRNITNNNPDDEPLETIVRTFLVNNGTGRIYGDVNEGSESVKDRGVAKGTSLSTFDHLLSRTAPTGLYHITLVFDVIYKAQFKVAQYIKLTENFNITSIQDTITLNEVVIEDFFSNKLNTSANTQSSSTLPVSNSTNTFTVLTEGFHSEFCLNLTNNRAGEVEIFIESLILENPTTFVSQVLVTPDTVEEADIVSLGTETLCFDNILPTNLNTHSDYRFSYNFRIGDTEGDFQCEQCDFSGTSDYFYVASIEDMISIPKFITAPTSSNKGRPGVFIMNEKNEKLYMFDDYNYTDQVTTDWDNSSVNCKDKDDGSLKLCDMSVYPKAGKPIKACFEAKSYFRNEVFVTTEFVSIDRDSDESVVILRTDEEILETSIKSTTDSDMYLSTAPSRVFEGDGELVDGRNFFCTDWMTIPMDTYGANDWDIQVEFLINSEFYNLDKEITWQVESDEFPIYGKIEQQPLWNLHLFEPIHYQIPEKWEKINNQRFDFNLSINQISKTAGLFNFGEHFPIRILDEKTPLERIINITITYQNGTSIPHTTELSSQQGEIILIIENVNLSKTDNNFTLTANTLDIANESLFAFNRSASALEGIENKTGTFKLSVNCPSTGKIGSNIRCQINAQIENSQQVEKEVDFTCYILKDGTRYSSQNFNQMVTKNLVTLNKDFLIPATFEDETPLVLQCEAGYYNLGSRTDKFFDTFIADTDAPNSPGLFDDLKTKIKELFSPESTSFKIFVLLFILGSVLSLVYLSIFISKKKYKKFEDFY